MIVERVSRDADQVVIKARAAAATATCPGCGTPSARVPGHRLAASRPAGAADLLPDVHYVDSGHVSVGQVLAAVDEHAVVLIGPLPPDTSWQAADPDAFDLTKFTIDRDARYVVCPNGKVSRNWQHAYSRDGLPVRRR